MLPSQVDLIQTSFAKVVPISDQAAALFYGRLFEIAPQVKHMFKGDMAEQGRKLMSTLAVVVKGLSNLDAVVPAAQALARRHVAYGVEDPITLPCAALLWTLEQGLGPDFTPDVKAAWAEAYGLLVRRNDRGCRGRGAARRGGVSPCRSRSSSLAMAWPPPSCASTSRARRWGRYALGRGGGGAASCL